MIRKKTVKLFSIITMILFAGSLQLLAQKIHKVPIQRYGVSAINHRVLWKKTSGELTWYESDNKVFIKTNYKGVNKDIILDKVVFTTYNLETERSKKGVSINILYWSKGSAFYENYGMVNILFKHMYPVDKKGNVSYYASMIEVVITLDDKQIGYSNFN